MVFVIQMSLQKLAKNFKVYFSYFVEDADTSIKFIKANANEKKEEPVHSDENDDNFMEGPVKSITTDSDIFTVGDYHYVGISVKVAFKNKNIMQTT